MLADKYSPERILRLTCILYIVCAIPCYYLVYAFKEPLWLGLLFIIYSLEEASIPSLMRNYFPVSIRYTGASLSYNLSMGLLGGISPALSQFFLINQQLPYGIAYILIASSVAVLWILQQAPEERSLPLTAS